MHRVAVGAGAVCQSLVDVRVPSDADLYPVWGDRHAARRLHRYLLPVRYRSLLHWRRLCPTDVTVHSYLTTKTDLSDFPRLHRNRVAARRAYQPAKLSRQLEDVLSGTINTRRRVDDQEGEEYEHYSIIIIIIIIIIRYT